MLKNASGHLGGDHHFASDGGPKPFDDDDDDLQNSPPRLSPMQSACNEHDDVAINNGHLPDMQQMMPNIDAPLSYKNSCEMVNVGGEEASDDSDADGDCSTVADLDRPPKAPAMQMLNDEHDVSQDHSDIYVSKNNAVTSHHHQLGTIGSQQLISHVTKQTTHHAPITHQFDSLVSDIDDSSVNIVSGAIQPVVNTTTNFDHQQSHVVVVASPKKVSVEILYVIY